MYRKCLNFFSWCRNIDNSWRKMGPRGSPCGWPKWGCEVLKRLRRLLRWHHLFPPGCRQREPSDSRDSASPKRLLPWRCWQFPSWYTLDYSMPPKLWLSTFRELVKSRVHYNFCDNCRSGSACCCWIFWLHAGIAAAKGSGHIFFEGCEWFRNVIISECNSNNNNKSTINQSFSHTVDRFLLHFDDT